MTGTEAALVITSVGTLVAAAGGVWIGVRNSRQIKEVHDSTNGKMDQLVQEVRKASFAEGKKAEKDNPT